MTKRPSKPIDNIQLNSPYRLTKFPPIYIRKNVMVISALTDSQLAQIMEVITDSQSHTYAQ